MVLYLINSVARINDSLNAPLHQASTQRSASSHSFIPESPIGPHRSPQVFAMDCNGLRVAGSTCLCLRLDPFGGEGGGYKHQNFSRWGVFATKGTWYGQIVLFRNNSCRWRSTMTCSDFRIATPGAGLVPPSTGTGLAAHSTLGWAARISILDAAVPLIRGYCLLRTPCKPYLE